MRMIIEKWREIGQRIRLGHRNSLMSRHDCLISCRLSLCNEAGTAPRIRYERQFLLRTNFFGSEAKTNPESANQAFC
jgi:hypothetical protein